MAPVRKRIGRRNNYSTNNSKSKYRKLSSLLLQLNDKIDGMGFSWNQKFNELSTNVPRNGFSLDARKIESRLIEIQNHMKEATMELGLTISMCHDSDDLHISEIVPEPRPQNNSSLVGFNFKVDTSCRSVEPIIDYIKSVETQTLETIQTTVPKLCDAQTQTSETEDSLKKGSKSNLKQRNIQIPQLSEDLDDAVFLNVDDKIVENKLGEKSPETLTRIEQEIFKSRSRIARSPLKGKNPTREPSYIPTVVENGTRNCTFFAVISPPKKNNQTTTNKDEPNRSIPLKRNVRPCSISSCKGTPPIRSQELRVVPTSATSKKPQPTGNGTLGLSQALEESRPTKKDTFSARKLEEVRPIAKVSTPTTGNVTFCIESATDSLKQTAPIRNVTLRTMSLSVTPTQNDPVSSSTSVTSLKNNEEQRGTAGTLATLSKKSLVGRLSSSTSSPAIMSRIKKPKEIFSTPSPAVSNQDHNIPGPSNATTEAPPKTSHSHVSAGGYEHIGQPDSERHVSSTSVASLKNDKDQRGSRDMSSKKSLFARLSNSISSPAIVSRIKKPTKIILTPSSAVSNQDRNVPGLSNATAETPLKTSDIGEPDGATSLESPVELKAPLPKKRKKDSAKNVKTHKYYTRKNKKD